MGPPNPRLIELEPNKLWVFSRVYLYTEYLDIGHFSRDQLKRYGVSRQKYRRWQDLNFQHQNLIRLPAKEIITQMPRISITATPDPKGMHFDFKDLDAVNRHFALYSVV